MWFIGKLSRNKQGAGSIIGAVFILLILLTGFTYYFVNVNVTEDYNKILQDMRELDLKRNKENIELTSVTFNDDTLNIAVKNTGSYQAHLIWLGIFDEAASPTAQKYYKIDFYVNPAETVTNIGNDTISSFEGQERVIQLVTELGNTFSYSYPEEESGYDFVDKEGDPPTIGSHSLFSAQQAGPNGIVDTLTEENTGNDVGTIDIGLVVESAGSPDSRDQKWKSWLESRDYVTSVTYEDVDTVTTGTLNGYDLVFMAYSVGDDADASKCKGLSVPVMFVNRRACDDIQFGTGHDYDSGETATTIVDNSHFITTVYSEGSLTVQESWYMSYITGWSQDVTNLATIVGWSTRATVLYLEKGQNHIDGSTATERIVFSGIGYYQDSSHDLTADGENLTDRCIHWAMGWETKFELDLEVQWTNADYDETNEWLCIYGGTMGDEDILVDVWNGTDWITVFDDLASGWNSVDVSSYLTSATFKIRFRASSDTTQHSWEIDATFLYVWT